MIIIGIILITIASLYILYATVYPPYKPKANRLSVFYGAAGSGKSTLAAYYALRTLKAGYNVYSNVPIKGCKEVSKDMIGKQSITDGLLIIDESGIEYNNRDFRSNFNKKADNNKSLEWFKKHRHEGVEIMIFSQGFADTDIKITTLGTDYYIVKKHWLFKIVKYKRITKKPEIDEITKQPIDAFEYKPLSGRFVFMRPLWPFFDSFDRMDLPVIPFRVYGESGVNENAVDRPA